VIGHLICYWLSNDFIIIYNLHETPINLHQIVLYTKGGATKYYQSFYLMIEKNTLILFTLMVLIKHQMYYLMQS
jgi:hypothetical protein